MTPRYAIYFAPASSEPLWRFGSEHLGYDAASGAEPACPAGLPVAEAEWRSLTAAPRRYGFHATLKAPFHLRPGAGEAELVDAARAVARGRAAIRVPALRVATVGSFAALVLGGAEAEVGALADACVRDLEPFREPLSASDRARRLAAPLTERQLRHLDRWGYPYVFEEYRFHMTLTGPLPAELREPVRAALAERHAALPPGLGVDALTIFRQDDRDGRFRILRRVPLGP